MVGTVGTERFITTLRRPSGIISKCRGLRRKQGIELKYLDF